MMISHVTMDRAGRIVVPKEVRDRNGLHEGSRFVIEDDGSMRPAPASVRVHYLENGWPVFNSGGPAHDTDVHALLHEQHAERERHFAGGTRPDRDA